MLQKTSHQDRGSSYAPAFPDAASPMPAAAARRFALRHLAGLLPVAAVLVPMSILAVVGWHSWHVVWGSAEAEMRRAAESAAEYGKRTLESYSVAAGRINDRLRGLSDDDIRADEQALQKDVRGILGELSQTELAYVIDAKGYPLIASNIYPAPRDTSLSDLDYFQALSGADPPAVYISKTFVGRFDGRLLFSVSRVRRDTGNRLPPNQFDGLVTVSVNPHVLADGMRRLLPEPSDRMALMRLDGYGVSTTSGLLDLGKPLPKVDPSSPFYTFVGRGVRSANYISVTAMPGSASLLAMHLIDGFPIYAVSIRPRSEIVARWWSIMVPQLAFGMAATLGLLALSLKVWRDQRRLAKSNVSLRRDNDLSTDRLVRAERFGLVGTFEFDPRTGIGRRSAEYMSVHGFPAVPAQESLDEWAGRLHPDDRQRAQHELRDILADPDLFDYAQTYRIVTPGGQVRWIAARGEIARDGTGRAIMLLGAHVDVTPLRSTEMALAESDARLRLVQEAVGIGAWEWLRSARSLKFSPKMMDLCGFDPAGGMPSLSAFLSRMHPEDRAALRKLMRQVKRAGGFTGEFRMLRPRASGEPETVWVAARAKLIMSPEAPHPLLMGIAYDISDRKRAEDLTTLMAHEVEHRAKNALTVVSSLLRMTKASSAEELARVMDGRVTALTRTMALLGRGRWTGADLRDILSNELRPFELAAPGNGFVIEMSGPPVLIDVNAAQPLSMALHELATNAAKYGALSVPGGSLHVEWRIEAGQVHLCWRERGGPPLSGAPPRSGFGSRLITMLFEGQIGGLVTRRWEAAGLVCEMSFPLRPDG